MLKVLGIMVTRATSYDRIYRRVSCTSKIRLKSVLIDDSLEANAWYEVLMHAVAKDLFKSRLIFLIFCMIQEGDSNQLMQSRNQFSKKIIALIKAYYNMKSQLDHPQT